MTPSLSPQYLPCTGELLGLRYGAEGTSSVIQYILAAFCVLLVVMAPPWADYQAALIVMAIGFFAWGAATSD